MRAVEIRFCVWISFNGCWTLITIPIKTDVQAAYTSISTTYRACMCSQIPSGLLGVRGYVVYSRDSGDVVFQKLINRSIRYALKVLVKVG